MKKAWQIARLELNLLFYSPIAWLLLIVLIIQMNLGFVPVLDYMQRAAVFKTHFKFLTSSLFTNTTTGGIFWQAIVSLYLYLPLLTMGLLSRETSSGTIGLLYSSPLSTGQIILGKFMAMLTYNLILTGVFVLYIIGGAMSIIHFDYGLVIAALIGIYLLLGAYAAIGLFMSSLTTYQVVAAISTFVVFAILNYIGEYGQGKDFIRDLTHSLSMPGRTEKMVSGLLTTRDISYFLIIMYIFLSLTISKLGMAREARSFWFRAGRYTLIVLSGLVAAYASSRPRYIGYLDATATKVNTLRQNTRDILQQLGDAPVEVTEYTNFMDPGFAYSNPYERLKDVDRWEPYLRFKSNINIKWVYYYDSLPGLFSYPETKGKTLEELVQIRAKFYQLDIANVLTPRQLRQQVDLRDEGNHVIMQLKYKDRTLFLRTFNDPEFWPGETETAVALKRLLVKAPKIAFLTGGYQRSIDKIGDRDYKLLTNLKTFRYALINQGFDVDTLSLENGGIPEDIAALVIADPRVSFDTCALTKIRQYIGSGGNLLLAGEPGKQAVSNPLLKPLGLQLMDGAIVQRSKDFSYDLVTPFITEAGAGLSGALKYSRDENIPVTMPGVAGLSYDRNGPFHVRPLLMTDAKKSWNKKGPLVLDSAALVFEAANGDVQDSFPTALALTRMVNGKEQRIVITGDADFLSNAELGRSNLGNADFLFGNGIFGWFAYGEFPIDTARPRSRDNHVSLSAMGVLFIKLFYWGLLPGLLALIGAILLIRRKRK